MKNKNPAKQHYQRLRVLSCEELWEREVAAFDRATSRERIENVAVVRAVGVVFSERGTDGQKEQARKWLRELLRDPDEKVRRYAMNALPKIGTNAGEESDLLDLLGKTSSDRERKFLGRALEKIGGEATQEALEEGRLDRLGQKVAANVARQQTPSIVRLDHTLADAAKLRINLRCRDGLERILEDELYEQSLTEAKFRMIHSMPGLVTIEPVGILRLSDIYELRCFGAAGIVLGTIDSPEGDEVEAIARIIASSGSRRVLAAFTDGPIRYRLEFVSKGHQRGAVRVLADRIYELCPELLNDSRDAPWQIDIHHAGRRISVELTPRLRPDPRFAYRRRDVPAASHPPLAACMARLAGIEEDEVVWDPFCGSGLELIERARRGGVRQVVGTDLSAAAIEIVGENFAAAIAESVRTSFAVSDFRDYAAVGGLGAGAVSLMISNPPMGRRVPIPDLRGLIEDLFAVAGEVLKP
ncbi:MAG: hypothetical protein ACREKL_03165, partial [Chthoniobacterales bacterium]